MELEVKDIVKELLPKWQDSPEAYFVDVLGVKPENIWPKMREIMEGVKNNPRTAVKAAHGVSKTYTAARLALWFLYCFGPRATVITTAPSHQQVEDVLWREIRDAHSGARIPLGGEPTKTKLELSDKWFAIGFATRPDTVTQQATNFQGLHNDCVLIIFEEAAGIAKEIWEAADSLMQGGTMVRFLAIGNPTSASGEFVECFKSSAYHHITVSVMDTPNYQQKANVISGLSGHDFVDFVIKKYGEDSAYYKSRVLGEIPDEDVDALLPFSEIEKAIDRKVMKWNYDKRFVVWDVADGGDDAHQIYGFLNTDVIECVTFRGKKIEEAEPYVWQTLKKIGGNAIIVDGDGVGRVAIGLLNSHNVNPKEISVKEFFGSEKSFDEATFNSRKSEAAWELRRMMINEEITLPNDSELLEELSHYKLDPYHKRGLIALEKKDLMKERIGRSPDKGDCFIMLAGFWNELKPVQKHANRWKTSYKDSTKPTASAWAA